MIQDKRQIQIRTSPERVFEFIEKMPNKFPVYGFLETKPFFFLRMLFVDGFRSAVQAVRLQQPDADVWIMEVGDPMGPFILTESARPHRYWFTLESFFFHCRTGYTIRSKGGTTTLNFDIVAEDPRFLEKVWWVLIKPLHGLLANKVLRVLKERIETRGNPHTNRPQDDHKGSVLGVFL